MASVLYQFLVSPWSVVWLGGWRGNSYRRRAEVLSDQEGQVRGKTTECRGRRTGVEQMTRTVSGGNSDRGTVQGGVAATGSTEDVWLESEVERDSRQQEEAGGTEVQDEAHRRLV